MEGDRGYDDKNLIVKLLDKQKIKSVIDICNKWIDSDKTRLLLQKENVVYNTRGPCLGCALKQVYNGKYVTGDLRRAVKH